MDKFSFLFLSTEKISRFLPIIPQTRMQKANANTLSLEPFISAVPTTSMSFLWAPEISCSVRLRSITTIVLAINHLALYLGSDEGPWNHSFRFEQ